MSGRTVGPYAIQGLLGSGGIGHVYAALDQDLGRLVALKALRPEFSHDPDLLERFRGEAANLARLNHPNITTLYSLYREAGPQRQNVFMVMEMVNGETLEAILARLGRLSTPVSLAVMAQAVAGLSYAHSVGIIHRDIKPSNMMLNDAGLLKITDFGIARVQGSQRLTRHGAVVGTLNYIAPEQIKGRETDERSDLYSLACVLYELLSGRKPFVGPTEYELIRAQLEVEAEPLTASMPGLEPHIDQAVMRALAKNPDDRFSTVAEFAEALGTAAIQDSAVAIVREQVAAAPRPPNPPEEAEPFFFEHADTGLQPTQSTLVFQAPAPEPLPAVQAPTRRRRAPIAAAAAAAVVLLSGGAYLAYTMGGPVAVDRDGQPRPPSEAAAAKATPSSPASEPAVTQAAPSHPKEAAAPETSPRPDDATQAASSHPQGEPALTQSEPPQSPNAPAPAQAAPPAAPQHPDNATIAQAAPAPTSQPTQPEAAQPEAAQPEAAQSQAVQHQPEPSQPASGSAGAPGTPAASGDTGDQKQPQAAAPSGPAGAPLNDEANQSAPAQQPASQDQPAPDAAAKTIAGPVSAYSPDGWPVIDGVTVRLSGVGPLAPGEAKPVSDWIATHGNYLACTASLPGGYRCLTQQNFDLAQAILLNGAARTSSDAAPAYREAEAHARTAKRGVWR